MVTELRPEKPHLHPEKLRLLLHSARIVGLGLSPARFEQMVILQKRLKERGYKDLSPQETTLVADIWERLKKYTREQNTGWEHLVSLFIPSDMREE